MFNFYDRNKEYTLGKTAELTANEAHIDAVLEIRQAYKVLTGQALRSFLCFHNASELCDDDTVACWCEIANDSHLFREDVHMLQCMLDETVRPNEPCIALGLRKKTAESKGDFNELMRICRREARIIKVMYDRVGRFNPDYNGAREYRRIRRALLFIKLAISACLYSKLPTMLDEEEYDDLCRRSIYPDNPAKRYRYNSETKKYLRIGGLPRRRPYKLFGIRGCTVFIRKCVNRYEAMVKPFIV